MRFCFTPGNRQDCKIAEKSSKGLKGWLFGDKGYLGKALARSLKKQGLEIFTTLSKNMKERIFNPLKQRYLKKRCIIETIIDQLKKHFYHKSLKASVYDEFPSQGFGGFRRLRL